MTEIQCIKVRFFKKVTIPDLLWKCWGWEGAVDPQGYSRIGIAGESYKASWVSWLLHKGKWPTLHTLHSCDNRICTNFIHLFQGTNQDNTDDKIKKGRHDHWYSDNEIRKVFELRKQGLSQFAISRITGVSQPHICAVLNGRFMKARVL
jgi:hypothetical protein